MQKSAKPVIFQNVIQRHPSRCRVLIQHKVDEVGMAGIFRIASLPQPAISEPLSRLFTIKIQCVYDEH